MNNKRLQRQIRGYLRQINNHLPFSYKAKKIILHNLYRGIKEYIAIFPNATMEDIYEHFGTYKEITSDIIKDSSTSPHKNNPFCKQFYVVSLLVILLLILGNYHSRHKNN